MSIIKTRRQKEKLYNEFFSDIPRDFNERLNWLYDKLHLNTKKALDIIHTRDRMVDTIHYSNEIYLVLYEIPEGAQRPRARLNHTKDLINSEYIQIYSPTGSSDKKHMRKLVNNVNIDYLINTPCNIKYDAYLKTPSNFNATDTFLSELGYVRPISKPDFDNIMKKYADMYNSNIWLDDLLVNDCEFHKYYSVLPRIEITLRYLNMVYNKYQYNTILKNKNNNGPIDYFGSIKESNNNV